MTRGQRLLLLAILVVGAALRLACAWGATGMFHPDDIHQSLEPAHGVVYGTGLRSWEFQHGARPWTVPGVYVLLLGLLKLLGLTAPEGYTLVVRLFNALVAASWPWLCFRVARALHSPRAGLIAAWLAATWYFAVLLAPRALSHLFSVTFALWAVARVVEDAYGAVGGAAHGAVGDAAHDAVGDAAHDAAHGRSRLFTGVLLGLAFAFRYQEGLVAAGLALFLLLERRARLIPRTLLGALGPIAAVALLDWATWGRPLRSLFVYLALNVGQERAREYGVEPWSFYLAKLPATVGGGGVLLLFVATAPRRALLLAITVAGLVLGTHSLIDHKEIRFVLAATILLLCVAGCGVAAAVDRLGRAGRRRAALALLLAAPLLWAGGSLASAATLTFADLGTYSGLAEERASPWTFRRDVNRALARVGRRADLCALAVLPYGRHAGGARLVSTGGYTFFHRAAPLDGWDLRTSSSSLHNYVVACAGEDGRRMSFPEMQEAERVGECAILRRRPPLPCDPGALATRRRDYTW